MSFCDGGQFLLCARPGCTRLGPRGDGWARYSGGYFANRFHLEGTARAFDRHWGHVLLSTAGPRFANVMRLAF